MENQFFLNNSGVPHHPIHLENSHPSWSSAPMEIQHDCFYNPAAASSWDKSTADHALQFDSALSSMVSSPAASNSSIPSDNLVIRELIGKLGTIGGGSGGEISPHSQPLVAASSPYINGMPSLGGNGKPMALSSAAVAEFSADPGFAERAAKFSCFGSRSFNGRTSQLAANNASAAAAAAAAAELAQRSNSVIENNGRLPRVSSSPSLKTLGSQMAESNKKPCQLLLQDRMEAVANSQEESTISEQTPNGGGEAGVRPSPETSSRKRKASSKGKGREASTPPVPNKGVEGSEDPNAKRSKPSEGEGDGNGTVMKAEEDEKQNKSNSSKPPEPPKDYIHVRARRGQATDSHSLAERVRREKISERMKLLQDLVPGCNKVTGKALMLDEIINYVQSLQRQVEFLSMKLASVNTRMDLSIESFIPKDIFQANNSLAHPVFQLDSSATDFYGHQSQQNPVIHNNIPNGTVTHTSVDPLLDNNALCQNILGMQQLPPLNGFNEVASQFPLTFSEDDLNTIVQMGFGQTANSKTPIQSPPSFNGSNQAAQMKVEL